MGDTRHHIAMHERVLHSVLIGVTQQGGGHFGGTEETAMKVCSES